MTPATKEVVAEEASDSAWFNRNMQKASRTRLERSTPGDICHAVSVVEPPSPVLIGTVSTSSPCGLNASQQVANKRQSNTPNLVGQYQKLDAIVDRKLPDDLNSTSIFSNVIGHKLSNGSNGDLYLSFRMKFAVDTVQTQAPQ